MGLSIDPKRLVGFDVTWNCDCRSGLFGVAGVSHLIPLAVLVTGSSLGIVGERCNRQYRYQRTRLLSLWDLVLAMVIGAANWAVWCPIV